MSLLRVQGLGKSFGGTAALTGVDFELRPGEVHALVGENGAGKSTLCRIVAGLLRSDAGAMWLRDQPYAPASRREGERAGVRMVMQELNLLPTLSVAENIFLDAIPRSAGVIRYRELNAAAREAMSGLGLSGIEPDRPLSTLGVGQCQLIEIAAALAKRCEVLILDEPTAALTDAEIELLFGQIQRLKGAGVGIVYVSHRMEEIRRITDRITVLRDGKWIASRETAGTSHEEVVRLMVGRDLGDAGRRVPACRSGRPALRVRGLRRAPAVKEVSFDLHGGEILGLAGLMGSGRTETLRAIFGADPPDGGEIFLRGEERPALIRSPRQAVKRGIALVTEDRKGQGLLLPSAVRSNISLPRLGLLSPWGGWVNRKRESAVADDFVRSLSIRCQSAEQSVGHLSGGNQQKVVLSKWLFRDCDILLLDEPTRGVDIGAKFEIYELLHRLAAQGKAILAVSSELPELMAICDRIAVMSAGHLVKIFNRGEWSQDAIMQAALSRYMGNA